MSASADQVDAPAAPVPDLLLRALGHFDDAVLVTEAYPLDEPGPRILYANAAFTAMTGYAEHEVLGRSCRLLQGMQTDPAARAAMRRGLEEQTAVRVEVVNYRKDRTPFWVEVLITPLFDEAGQLTHFVSVQRDTTVRKQAELKLERLALRQELTGLLNRAGFERALAERLASSAAQPVAVLLADLTGLRDVNYTLGRQAGDDVLVEVARLLRGQHEADVTAQLGGGEFAVLIRQASVPKLVALCERLRRLLSVPVLVAGTEVVPQMSIGVALREEGRPDDLVRRADVARRAAVSEGRGRYALYEHGMDREAQRERDIDQGLRRALTNGDELHLHHQPVVGLLDGLTRHVEALLRWERPGVGAVSPAELIPVAEATGTVLPLGSWVLREACQQAAAWQTDLPGVGVAVNLSPKQFAARAINSDLEAALSVLPASLLTLEITEGALLGAPEDAARQLDWLVARGVRIALDDFGTGYSSLAYLKHLPVHELKIDRMFVAGLPASRGDRAIVKAVLGLAADLGVDVVAEGVETQEQQEVLLDLGCTLAQGYLFARPVAASGLPGACQDARQRGRQVQVPE